MWGDPRDFDGDFSTRTVSVLFFGDEFCTEWWRIIRETRVPTPGIDHRVAAVESEVDFISEPINLPDRNTEVS
jgi:hypothetical protein